MNHWLKRLRGMIGMGVTWAVAWAAGGLLIGVASKLLPFLPWDILFRVFDAPLPALAVPGFFGGPLMLLSAGSAAGSLALARRSERRELLEPGSDAPS